MVYSDYPAVPLQVHNRLEGERKKGPRGVAAVVIDARVDAVLEMLQKITVVALTVVATSLCAEA